MAARLLFGSLSMGFAFAAVLLLVKGVGVPRSGRARFQKKGSAFEGLSQGKLAWRLRNGFPSLMALAEKLMGFGRVHQLAGEGRLLLEARGFATTEESLVSVGLAVGMALALVAGLVTGGIVGSLAVLALVLAVVVAYLGVVRDKRQDAVRESIPDVLRSMGSCFGVGLTLLQTFQQVSSEVQGPLRTAFSHACHVLETGGSASEALGELRRGTNASELAFVAVALDVQHESGGSMKQVLDAARDSVEGELALRRSLKVQTAQARLSARVVSVMPFALIAVFSLVSKDFLTPFFASSAGYALLAVALGMQATGILLVRKMLSVGAET